jgi:serine/threonine protein kinase
MIARPGGSTGVAGGLSGETAEGTHAGDHMAAIPGNAVGRGALFARYTIVRQLGAGAMGEVYLAEHPRLPRRDALKVLATRLASDQDYRLRFAR